jgi:hypothetical protein
MKNNSFTVLSSVAEGELQLGGYGAYACPVIACAVGVGEGGFESVDATRK